ncbi:MAG: hypothetical protein PVI50_06675 [Gammaproteobacteria bacterium]
MPALYRAFFILALLGNLPAWPAAAQPMLSSSPVYRLNSLAANLAGQPAPLQADLARSVVEELAAAYRDEAQRARHDARNRAQAGELRRWVSAVERLAAEYTTLAMSILPDTPVELSTGPEGSLYLIVAGRPVIASSPRMREQTAFEQRVINRFCELNRCAGLLEEPVSSTVPAYRAERSNATVQWSFSQEAGPVCASGDGLEFQFFNMENLGPKREACARAMAELDTLTAAIAREVAGGIRMDWNRFVIQHLPDGQEQVLLNGAGDYLRLALPMLVARQELVDVVQPWLAARVNGQRYTLVVLNAGRVLAPAGRPLE